MTTKQLLSKALGSSMFVATLLFGSSAVFAQVKIGTNPTNIGSTSSLEVEAANNSKVWVQKNSGTLQVENKPSALSSDSIVTRAANGQLRQISISRLKPIINDSEIANWNTATFSPGTIAFGHPTSDINSVTPASFIGTPAADGSPIFLTIRNNSARNKAYLVTCSFGFDGTYDNTVDYLHIMWSLFLDGNDQGLRAYSEITPARNTASGGTAFVSGASSANGTITGIIGVPPGDHILRMFHRGRAFDGVVGANYTLGSIGPATIRLSYVEIN